ncbi:AraC family transcriptional regulator [Pseudomonas coronafaciens]|uniref:Helix-turn-helix domain-containing protein n=1 Tax=Pseudomonas coronafaciens pv. coronafaciens TaxID=235275 RepID=A0AAE6QFL6_9PSED|nr:AraC family transcriptional regulator [Pseudomonas coronafaciens]QGT81767.1 helix-turn-helix domain-containing protein [Pseudomonas coronafaciens pv. coronafaciens]QIQ74665.1 Virulence regulon transcriptional activator VirF [Pseudomonas coronafaciens]RMM85475.1 AraC family transcriptional regulator [Pseudomonas coronafaciens pv. striafaciens]
MNSTHPNHSTVNPFFWRDERLPFIEARSVEDGRKVCYAPHSHEFFSIGAIIAGQSTYLHEKTSRRVMAGTVVLMNPGDVHACNPINDQPWSYLMLYVDSYWLSDIQQDARLDAAAGFQPLPYTHSCSPVLFSTLTALYETLVDVSLDTLQKHCSAVSFFTLMLGTLGAAQLHPPQPSARVTRAADYINENFTRSIKLADICAASTLSASYLIRSFEQHYHLTPHAYLLNRRIQHACTELKQGKMIADVALESGFSDQAHFQREFKKHLAATPGQYRL